jgi:hypothetical protein
VTHIVLAALAVLLAAVGHARAQSAPTCSVGVGNASMTVDGDRSEREGYNVIVVAAPPGATAEVRVGCSHSDLVVEGGRLEPRRGGHVEAWFVPVRTGENRVTVRFVDRQGQRVLERSRRTITFTAWVYTIERWGELELPAGSEEIKPHLMDAAGHLYATLHPKASAALLGLVRLSPGGRIATRYQLGTGKVDHLQRLLGVDAAGNLYAVVKRNVVQFDPAGKFVRSLASLDTNGRLRSAADLDEGARPPADPRTPLAQFSHIAESAMAGGAFYLIAWETPRLGGPTWKHFLVRFTLDGKATVLGQIAGPGKAHPGVQHLHVGPDGHLYTTAYRSGGPGTVLVLSRDGALVREHPVPQGRSGSVWGGVDTEGMLLTDASCSRVAPDFSRRGGGVVNARYIRNRAFPARGETLTIDLLTGQEAKNLQTFGGQCWVHRGVVYAIYGDRQVARFTLQGAAGTVVADAPPAPAPAPPPAKLALRFGPYLDRADLAEGVVLDDQVGNVVTLGAVLTDDTGRPMPGVEVELSLNDQQLPVRGAFTVRSTKTDAQGRVSATYKPPRLLEAQVRRGAVIGVEARARLQGAAPLVAQANVLAYPLVQAVFRISRAGYTPVEGIAVPLASLQAGKVMGTVVHTAAIRHDLAAPAGSAARRGEKTQFPVNHATVELLTRQGTRLGQAETDPRGGFTLEFAADPGSPGRPLTVVPEFLEFKLLDPEVGDLPRDVRDALQALRDKRYGYRVDALVALAEAFPRRLAAAGDDGEALREIDRLFRVGMLAAALWKTHDLVAHAAAQWTASIETLVEDLLAIFDPLNAVAPDFHVVDAAGRTAIRSALKKPWLQQQLVQRVLGKLGAQWKKRAFRRATEKAYDATAWEWVKDQLQQTLLSGGAAATGWKERITGALVRRYREVAQAELDQAARLWGEGKIPYGGRVGPLFRARYRELADDVAAVTARQLDRELDKANLKIFTSSVIQGLVVYGTATGAAPVVQATQWIDKGLKGLDTALDASQDNAWFDTYEAGIASAQKFAQAALRARVACLGAAC